MLILVFVLYGKLRYKNRGYKLKKVKFKIVVLILLFTCMLLTMIDISDNLVKNKDRINDLDNFCYDKIKTSQPSINDFAYYKEITIDHTKVSNDLTNFPILISIFDSDLQNHTQEDGDDIAFYNGSEWLDHEIELFDQSYNTTHAQLIAWVRIPSLSSSIDTNITMYYGNPTTNSLENPEGVWDSNYMMVQHLHETSGTHYDSTNNNNDGTPNGNLDQSVTGKIDGDDDFNGIDANVEVGDNSSLDITNAITIEAWINVDVKDRIRIITKGDEKYVLRTQYNGDLHAYLMKDSTLYYAQSKNNLISTGSYHHVVLTWDGVSGDHYLRLYYDGYELSQYADQDSVTYPLDTSDSSLFIGSHESGEWWDGEIDEVRISNISRSADWIATEYINQNDPGNFYSIGSEQNVDQQQLLPNKEYFTYYKKITIDHTKVSGSSDLINFPVLISILDSDLHDIDKVQADGDDIAFSNGTSWLDHEIEQFNQTYNSTHAKLVSWVRLSVLSPSIDTNITMYYGNSTMTSRQNPSSVWNSDYGGVWHLHDNFNDSTSNNNYGTNHGSSDVVGQIANAQDFAGYDTDQEITIAPSESLNPTYITVSAWIYPRGQVGDTGMFVSDYDWTDNSMKVYNLYMHPTNRVHLLLYYSNGNGSYVHVWSDVMPMYEWHLVHFTVSSTTVALFVDGVIPTGAETVATASYTGGLRQYTNVVEIGSEEQMSSCDHEFNGTIDEVRISSSAHSADWIATEYNNQFNPNNFYSVGSSQKVDPISPSWSNLIETEPLGLGEVELISIDVFDLYGVAQVIFEIESTNYTMVNVGGNTWQNNTWIPSSTGDYDYTIYMQDTNNNWNIMSGSILVIDRSDTTPPTWSNLTESADPLELGNSETITIDVFDVNGTHQVLFEIESTNYTMVNIGGNTWQNDTWIPSSTGNYDYTIYMQDNNNNWNTTTGSIEVIDNRPPSWSNLIETEPLELGNAEIISIDVFDLSGVVLVLFEIENNNYTMVNIGGNTWQNDTWIPFSTGDYDYTIYMKDTNNFLNTTSGSIQVIDTTPPTYSELTESGDPLELGDTEIITIKIIDLSGINQVLIEINGEANYTMEWIGGNLWRNNSWTPKTKGTQYYRIFMQDNYNNWNSTTGSIEVIESHLPNGGFDFTTLLIIIGISGGTIGAVIGIIIFIKKRPRKPKDKELDTIESIID